MSIGLLTLMVIRGKSLLKIIYIESIKTNILYNYFRFVSYLGGCIIESDIKRLYDLTDYLIKQQFYLTGTDTILGRTPDIKIKIKHSGKIISRFKALFINNINFFLEGKYLEFLESFKKIKGIDDNYLKEVYQDIQIKIATGHAENFEVPILYTIILSSLISGIREVHFDEIINEIIERANRENPNLTKNHNQLELDKLFMKNNQNLSLLYNLSFLDALAESFNFKSVSRRCKLEKSKYLNLVVSLLISSKGK